MNPEKLKSEKVKLGNRMRTFRIKCGYTSTEKFSFDNDISRPLYSNWESGRGNITYKNLLKIVEAYGTTLKDFFSSDI